MEGCGESGLPCPPQGQHHTDILSTAQACASLRQTWEAICLKSERGQQGTTCGFPVQGPASRKLPSERKQACPYAEGGQPPGSKATGRAPILPPALAAAHGAAPQGPNSEGLRPCSQRRQQRGGWLCCEPGPEPGPSYRPCPERQSDLVAHGLWDWMG